MTNLTSTIDALGALKAQIAKLEVQEKALKASLASLDVGNYEGDLFRLTVTAPEREKLSDELKARIKEVTEEFRASLRRSTAPLTSPRCRCPPSPSAPAAAKPWQRKLPSFIRNHLISTGKN